MKKFQSSTFDTIARRRLVEDQDAILELTAVFNIQPLTNWSNRSRCSLSNGSHRSQTSFLAGSDRHVLGVRHEASPLSRCHRSQHPRGTELLGELWLGQGLCKGTS